MKINNETKIGILASIAILLFVVGFNFIRAKTTFKTGNYIYAKYKDAKSLMVSNPVYINGFQVGNVSEIQSEDETLQNIIITIKLKSNYNIPNNSIAMVKSSILGTPSIEIKLGDSKTLLSNGATIQTIESEGMLGDITKKIDPITTLLKNTLQGLDSTIDIVNSLLSKELKGNIASTVSSLDAASKNIAQSTLLIQQMLDKNGSIHQSFQHVEQVTKNLADNNEKVNGILSNLNSTTQKFNQADLAGTVTQLKSTVQNLDKTIQSINSSKGSLGLLINDKALYNNLNNTLRSTNTLLDDLRMHPKRYVSFSVFGKKDKQTPLSKPISDSSKAIAP